MRIKIIDLINLENKGTSLITELKAASDFDVVLQRVHSTVDFRFRVLRPTTVEGDAFWSLLKEECPSATIDRSVSGFFVSRKEIGKLHELCGISSH